MSVQPTGEPAADSGKYTTTVSLFLIAIVCSTVAIMIFNTVPHAVFLSIILIWPAFAAGASAVKDISSYGIGTGVASIGMLGAGVGTIAAFSSIFIDMPFSALIGITAAFVIGFVTGLCANKIIKMKIPRMELKIAIMSASAAMIATLFVSIFSNNIDMLLTDVYIVLPLIFISTALAIIHPYNGSMGAGENQPRTLKLAFAEASLTTLLFGLISLAYTDTITSIEILLVSGLGFVIFTTIFLRAINAEIYKLEWSGVV